MIKSVFFMLLPVGLVACAPSDQGDSGDETFAPSNTTMGVVPHGTPNQGPSTAVTEGETSTRGAVDAVDAPTSARGKTTSNDGSSVNETIPDR